MKIQLIKEVKLNGDVQYFTEIDGKYLDNSLSFDMEKAKEYYNAVLENKRTEREVLQTTVIK